MYFEKMQKRAEELRKQKDVIVLGVETSCDETSVAVVKNGREVLSNIVSSQIDIHARFGGVVPEVASRNHVMAITNVLDLALKTAKITLKEVDAVAVTYGAGLIGALMVGVAFAKSLAFSLGVPLVAVNHIQSHVAANYLTHKHLAPPFMALIVSGGHTAIVQVDDYVNFRAVGSTLDDAVGEAYDKVARVLGLGYPGGPKIDKLAKEGKAGIKFIKNNLKNSFDFTFSGLKTAVINYVNSLRQKGKEVPTSDVCASFQSEAMTPLIDKSLRACKQFGRQWLCVAGGVSANSFLREKLGKMAEESGVRVFFPALEFCTDNAAMVGAQGFFNLISGVGLSDLNLDATSALPL